MHDWVLGTNGKVVSMAVPADGSYDIELWRDLFIAGRL